MDSKRSDSVESLPEPLSERELEVLACLAEGLSNQEIANKLYLAVQTVRWYNSQIYSKLSVSNRHDALERAHAFGLLQDSAPAPIISGKHNLPIQATPFIGREHELIELTHLLADENTRLITILAPGGMGKTRLALEAARLQIGQYSDGVIFVPLAPLSSPSDIVTTIAENIGFVFHGESTPAQQLIDFLRDRSMFLVLDNFEHLMDGAQLVADLIQSAPNIRLLTTSRERLNLRGETVYTLRGLEFPTWETSEDALQYDAVKLFMQSAHRVRADFALQSHDLDFLARICRLTAGLPLGIELAAGWVDILSLEQIAAEIQKGIDILETEMRDVPERQRSIRATFDHTWERLTADEQAVFMRLSVFRGGFTIEAAQTAAGASVRSLKQLANKALLQVSPDGRHDIHELLRQFGAEKLTASDEQEVTQAKHAAYFADFMAERKQDINSNSQLKALALIDPNFENVRSAWMYVVNQQQWEQLPKFLHSLWFYCDARTRGREGIELLEQAVTMLQSARSFSECELALGRIFARLGWFYNDIGLTEKAEATYKKAINNLRLHDSPDDLLAAYYGYQALADLLNQPDVAWSLSQEGLDIARSVNDKNWEGNFLITSGFAKNSIGEFELALEFAEKGLSVNEVIGNRWGISAAYTLLGDIKASQEDYEEAKKWFDKDLILIEEFGHLFGIASNHTRQAKIALAQRNYSAARLHLKLALRILWDAGYYWVVPILLMFVAQMYAEIHNVDKATEILSILHKHSLKFAQTNTDVTALYDQLKKTVELERFAAAWRRGETWQLSAAITELLKEFEND